MGLSHLSGPLVTGPSNGASNPSNITALPVSPDRGPNCVFGGHTLMDPRFPYRGGGGTENNALLVIGLGPQGGYTVVDQAPSTIVVNNIAVAAAITSGTAMTLVSSSGAGITVMTAALFIPQTGKTVPTGKLAIDLSPALTYFGSSQSTAVADPTKNIARAVRVVASSGATGGAFFVAGYDLYGYPLTEKITAAAGTSGGVTTNGKKAFKFISTVTPGFTDTVSYSVGTTDIMGFPMRIDRFPYAIVGWAGAVIVSSTGFVAADTATATNTTGDVRGTYALQSASNGVVALQMFQTVSPANISSISGMFGVTPA